MKFDLKHFLTRKRDQIRNLKKWLPIIWNKYDWDYSYSLDIFKRALLDQAEFMESGKAYSFGSKDRATKIRTIVKLMDKVYNDEYSMAYMNQLREKYGENVLDFVFEEIDGGDYTLGLKYHSWDNADEIEKEHQVLLKKAHEKQRKAEKVLWKLVEHNIRDFWD